MTRFDFDVIGDAPPKPLPNVQKPPAKPVAEKQSGEKPVPDAGAQPQPAKERDRAA